MRYVLLGLVVFFSQSQAHADWLSLCQHQPASLLQHKADNQLAYYLAPDESISVLYLAKQRLTKQAADGQCQQLELNISAQDVLWAGFAPGLSASATNLALQGNMRDKRFLVSEVILPEATSAMPAEAEKKPPKTNRFSAKKSKSTWFWSPALWLESPAKIFKLSAKHGIKRIYITVPTANGALKNAAELRQFIAQAHQQGLQVWAVLGDKYAVTDEGVASFLTASASYAAFNDENIQSEKLDGLQLDIEPYLIPGYSQDPAAWLSKYAYVVSNIHLVAPSLPINIVIPFWFDPENPVYATMLDDVADSVEQITVMDYRTDPKEIRQKAIRFLDWGFRNQKAIEIALETLPLAAEQRRYYQSAPQGELWRLELGAKRVLLLLNEPRTAVAGITSYRFASARLIDGTDISFYSKKDQLDALLPILARELSVWPSFSGLAVHGLDEGLAGASQ